MFTAHVIGNLGSDAEVVQSNGKKFVTLSIADSRKFKNADGAEVSQTTWIDAIINDADAPILPYLRQGVKVCVYGNVSLRVYSSKKDRMMKAGATIHVLSIELCGGSSDTVPRELIDPETAMVFKTNKYYWVNRDNSKMKKDEMFTLVDAKGRPYQMNKQGFVIPDKVPQDTASGSDSTTNENDL